jgi:hypothetical protein
MWWTLAYLNEEEQTLLLWIDMGREDPVSGRDCNPSKELPWPTDETIMRGIRSALNERKEVECFIPDDMDIITKIREAS